MPILKGVYTLHDCLTPVSLWCCTALELVKGKGNFLRIFHVLPIASKSQLFMTFLGDEL